MFSLGLLRFCFFWDSKIKQNCFLWVENETKIKLKKLWFVGFLFVGVTPQTNFLQNFFNFFQTPEGIRRDTKFHNISSRITSMSSQNETPIQTLTNRHSHFFNSGFIPQIHLKGSTFHPVGSSFSFIRSRVIAVQSYAVLKTRLLKTICLLQMVMYASIIC